MWERALAPGSHNDFVFFFHRCLLYTSAFPGNDLRLGAQEAPPAILSVFLGDDLQAVVDSIIHGTPYTDAGKRTLRIGVDVLPNSPQDNTDRNRCLLYTSRCV